MTVATRRDDAAPGMTVTAAERSEHAERENTRARILAEAVELFAVNGFASTSTRELAEHMGFTKAALYYHFRTKDDLLAALVEPIADQIAGLAETPRRDGDAGRRDLLAGYLDLVAAHRRLMRVLYQDPAVGRNEEVKAIARRGYEPLVEALCVPGQDPVTARTRVRAALGSIHAALADDTLNEKDQPIARAAALTAACGALGIRSAGAAAASAAANVAASAVAVVASAAAQAAAAAVAAHVPSQAQAQARPEL